MCNDSGNRNDSDDKGELRDWTARPTAACKDGDDTVGGERQGGRLWWTVVHIESDGKGE